MKSLITICSILLLVSVAFSQESEKEQLGKITFPLGDNYVQPKGAVKWNNAQYKMPVYEYDKVKTEKQSRCEITFTSKKVMRVGEKSIVEITKDDAGNDEVKMEKGSAWLSLFLPWGRSKIRVKTPSSVCSIRGTVYRLDCDPNATTYRCYKGKIAVTPFEDDGETLADSTFEVEAGEELILVMNFEEYKKQQEKAFNDFKQKEMDDFERFKQQDQQQFDDMVRKDLEDFNKINNMNYKMSEFDTAEDMKSDWVQWNLERDKLIDNE